MSIPLATYVRIWLLRSVVWPWFFCFFERTLAFSKPEFDKSRFIYTNNFDKGKGFSSELTNISLESNTRRKLDSI